MPSPRIVLISGAPGSGKTTLGRHLADALSVPHVNKDRIREGLWLTDPSIARDGHGLLDDRWNRSPPSVAGLVSCHDSLCDDMEAAAIGLVCASEGVPCINIKDISKNELLRSTSGGESMLSELGVDQVARRAAAFGAGGVGATGQRGSRGCYAPI